MADTIVLPVSKRLKFQLLNENCILYGCSLSHGMFPQGCDSTNGNGTLILNLHPFSRIDIRIKKCTNEECNAISSPMLYNQGR